MTPKNVACQSAFFDTFRRALLNRLRHVKNLISYFQLKLWLHLLRRVDIVASWLAMLLDAVPKLLLVAISLSLSSDKSRSITLCCISKCSFSYKLKLLLFIMNIIVLSNLLLFILLISFQSPLTMRHINTKII